MEKINLMALRHSAFYSPYLMTFAGSFLKDEGLEASYKVATPNCTVDTSILSGSCHVSQSAVATRFADLEAGNKTDIRHFAQINERDGFYIAAREKDNDFTWQKLKGKKVLVDHFFQPYAMLNYALHKNNMSMSDLEVIDAVPADHPEGDAESDPEHVVPRELRHPPLPVPRTGSHIDQRAGRTKSHS